MKAVVAAFNQEKALVGAFSVITNLRMELFEALVDIIHQQDPGKLGRTLAYIPVHFLLTSNLKCLIMYSVSPIKTIVSGMVCKGQSAVHSSLYQSQNTAPTSTGVHVSHF